VSIGFEAVDIGFELRSIGFGAVDIGFEVRSIAREQKTSPESR
jgi:hypothetical protein